MDRLLLAIESLVVALNDHTEVMAALVEQNQLLIQAMAGGESGVENPGNQTLD